MQPQAAHTPGLRALTAAIAGKRNEQITASINGITGQADVDRLDALKRQAAAQRAAQPGTTLAQQVAAALTPEMQAEHEANLAQCRADREEHMRRAEQAEKDRLAAQRQANAHRFVRESGAPARNISDIQRLKTTAHSVLTSEDKYQLFRASVTNEAGCTLALLGPTGGGKTTLACIAIIKYAWSQRPSIYTMAADLLASYRSQVFHGKMTHEAWMRERVNVPLLVLDEIDALLPSRTHGAPMTAAAQQAQRDAVDKLREVLVGRHSAMRHTLLLGNLDTAELLSIVGEKVSDRMREAGGSITVDCVQLRQTMDVAS